MASRELSLRRPDTCIACGTLLEAGTRAWWDANERTITCLSCRRGAVATGALAEQGADSTTDASDLIDAGVAGASSQARYEYLHAKREAKIDARFGRLAGVVKFMTDDPQSTRAWKAGSIGERELATNLAASVGDRAVLLHDRRVPKTRGNIDHLAVSSNGVWVIDAKNYGGLIQRRDVGGWLKVEHRLFVGGRDRTKIIDALSWQLDAVRSALGTEQVPIQAAVCFTDAEWGWFTKPFELRGVLVTGPRTLAKRISESGALDPECVRRVAANLSHALPAK